MLEDVLPFVRRELDFNISSDPNRRALCGISSGGICAFNPVWHWPGEFTRVISHCGSFTNIRGGHNYPYLIRSTPRQPLRVLLQSRERNANIVTGNWPLANQQMASALDFAGYDFHFEFGVGGHNLCHGGALFADTLRWLLRSWSLEPDGSVLGTIGIRLPGQSPTEGAERGIRKHLPAP